jgi:hypothetical protein
MTAFSFHGDEDSSDICHTLVLSLARGGDAIGKDRGYGSIALEVACGDVGGGARAGQWETIVDRHDVRLGLADTDEMAGEHAIAALWAG